MTRDAHSPDDPASEASARAGTLPAPARAVLTAVLDCLVPPSDDGRLPGAGALGLADYVLERTGPAVDALRAGLEALDARARAHGAGGFAALSAPVREALLAEHAEADPGLLPGLVFHTYSGYYQQPAVLEALGMEGRPPHPKGYTLDAGDPTLLEPVRARPKLWREP